MLWIIVVNLLFCPLLIFFRRRRLQNPPRYQAIFLASLLVMLATPTLFYNLQRSALIFGWYEDPGEYRLSYSPYLYPLNLHFTTTETGYNETSWITFYDCPITPRINDDGAFTIIHLLHLILYSISLLSWSTSILLSRHLSTNNTTPTKQTHNPNTNITCLNQT